MGLSFGSGLSGDVRRLSTAGDVGAVRCAATVFGVSAVVLMAAACSPAATAADAYPARPIRVIAPYGAGGSYDVIARLMSARLGEQLGQQVLVDNRPGAAGRLGMEIGIKAPADGHTLVVVGNSQVIVPSVYKVVPYDLSKDLEYVSMVATITNTFVVHPSVPAATVAEFAAWSKGKPGSVRYGSGGTGGVTHLGGELFRTMTGADMLHVPYKAGALALNAQLGGEVQMNMLNLLNALPHIQSGKLRVLAVTGLKRSPYLPNVPTMDESGAKGFEVQEFHVLAMPRGAPAAVVRRMNQEIGNALASSEVQERLKTQAAEPLPSTPAEARRYVLAEQAKFARIVKQIGLSPEN
jgi:tripartite-type tricarboxylate transporter receptor subunit TctC